QDRRSVLATSIGTKAAWLEWVVKMPLSCLTVPRKARMIGVYRCLACPTGGRRRRLPGQEIPYIGFWGVAGSAGYKYPWGVRQIPGSRRGKARAQCPRGIEDVYVHGWSQPGRSR